jgi:hypothetical protein
MDGHFHARSDMVKCDMCEKEVNGFYDYKGAKIPICFEHYEDGSFSNYLGNNTKIMKIETQLNSWMVDNAEVLFHVEKELYYCWGCGTHYCEHIAQLRAGRKA